MKDMYIWPVLTRSRIIIDLSCKVVLVSQCHDKKAGPARPLGEQAPASQVPKIQLRKRKAVEK